MKKKVTYKEPSDYFTPSMRKVAEDWDRKHGIYNDSNGKKTTTKKGSAKKAGK